MSEVNSVSFVAREVKSPILTMRQLALGLDFDDLNLCEKHKRSLISVSNHALHHINDLIKISHLKDGLFEMEPVSVRSVCEDVLSELSSESEFKNYRIKPLYQNHSHLAYANQNLLRSVIYNFCTNAINYSESGLTPEILIRDFRTNYIKIAVRDYGPALPYNIWYKIRQENFNSPEEIAMRPGEAGLGLYISAEFSKAMNSKISATRHKDGVTFSIILPVSNQLSLFEE